MAKKISAFFYFSYFLIVQFNLTFMRKFFESLPFLLEIPSEKLIFLVRHEYQYNNAFFD
jgi:hypothetical protein